MKTEFQDFGDIELSDTMYPGMPSIPQLFINLRKKLGVNATEFNFDAGKDKSFTTIPLSEIGEDYEKSFNREGRLKSWINAVTPPSIIVSQDDDILNHIQLIEYIILIIDCYHAESTLLALLPANIKKNINVYALIAFYYRKKLEHSKVYCDSKKDSLEILAEDSVAPRCQDFLKHTASGQGQIKCHI
jgi:hypothetical protein